MKDEIVKLIEKDKLELLAKIKRIHIPKYEKETARSNIVILDDILDRLMDWES